MIIIVIFIDLVIIFIYLFVEILGSEWKYKVFVVVCGYLSLFKENIIKVYFFKGFWY